jgi:hypothetical protein
MAEKRDPLKQIMSDVRKEIRAGDLSLENHEAFMPEVERRATAAGLSVPADLFKHGDA